ncbi:hypothetical protein CALVIDRAFT_561603 [Calocera viscosa TUFC12733]|uniref:WD40 repeat-like protein n=1 Tax=Calocera viscosa (strain TUFC12733) TaxID=1330018 RepID=A0A167PX51_CALVF|nr:hypothetical protein CALVIDRAFT_561603 [Calocera viscosa TUFC12733]
MTTGLVPSSGGGETEAYRKASEPMLREPSEKASRMVWNTDEKDVFETGWDSTVPQWGGEMGQGLTTISDRVRFTLGWILDPIPLLATSTSDRLVCMFDLRPATAVQHTLLHPSPVPSLVLHPTAAHLLTSASVEGCCCCRPGT